MDRPWLAGCGRQYGCRHLGRAGPPAASSAGSTRSSPRTELTFSRFEVLVLLSFTRRGSMAMGRMSSRLQVAPGSVTNAVARLERQGLAKRVSHPTDGRERSPRSRPRGAGWRPRRRRALHQCRGLHHARIDQQAEQAQLFGLLGKFAVTPATSCDPTFFNVEVIWEVPVPPGSLRHRRQPLRRPRRRHQHHAPAAAGPGRRGDPPRPQPLGRRGRDAAVQEDVQGVAISSYQGGHMEYFRYLVDRLRRAGRGPTSGSTAAAAASSSPREIAELEAYGVARIFSPEDGQRLGLGRDDQHHDRGVRPSTWPPAARRRLDALLAGDQRALARRDHRDRGRHAADAADRRACAPRRGRAAGARSSASPAPAARASRR